MLGMADDKTYSYDKGSYGKRPLWQWILLYVVIGGVLYALAYYFFFANNSGYSSPANSTYDTQTQ